MMKNGILLLATGLFFAILAWVFFAYFQNAAFTILILILAVVVLAKPVISKFPSKKQ